ncbi:hypothetical protein DFP72DRAFT_896874 [Ephemerocybe angulata]|uniref:AA9 family lytic polysaccharide monooxygenase n=1 Tax=Ephemerocybe angulata TaxID=980116 RepID=A0A8H6M4K8_9AGAR|nr:hypothetical protein DFP72DRAFT_896874 [Tulosesus angulatus]
MKNLAYDVTVPASLASGEYLIRSSSRFTRPTRLSSTPNALSLLILSGGGSPNSLARFNTKFPGGYSMSDPGVNVDIYSAQAPSITTYQVPGPDKPCCSSALTGLEHSFVSRSGLEWADLVEG